MPDQKVPIRPRLILVDLDGTLLRINSFKFWVLYWNLFLLFQPRRWLLWVMAQLQRLSGKDDRVGMKKHLLELYEQWQPTLSLRTQKLFIWLLWWCRRKSVHEFIMRQRKRGASIYLVTAAPDVYVMALANKMGVEVAATTQKRKGQWFESLGENKVLATFEHLPDLTSAYHKALLITDHEDDLPLARVCDYTCLVSPSSSSREAYRRAGIRHFVFQPAVTRES
ncbi:HAD family hydrolase [Marinobacteraceae bacterium S3BR75-40.1]